MLLQNDEQGFLSFFGLLAALALLLVIGGQLYAVRGHIESIKQYEEEIRLRLKAESVMEEFQQKLETDAAEAARLPLSGQEKCISTEQDGDMLVEIYARGTSDGTLLAARTSLKEKLGAPSFYRLRYFLPKEGGEYVWRYKRL